MFLNSEPQNPLFKTKSSTDPKYKVDTSDPLNVSSVPENSV